MKPKTVAESIAELRDQLASIESTSANTTLTETAQPSNSLQEHMQQVEREYLVEKGVPGHKGSLGQWMYNAGRGLRGEKNATPGLEKIAGTDTYSPGASLSKSDKRAWELGKGVRRGAAGGIAAGGLGGAASLGYQIGTGGKTNDTTDGKINGQLDGGDPKPHTNPNYDEKTAHLQQWLLDQGADLGTTGPNGDGVDGIMGEKTRQAAKDHHIAGYENSPPPVTPTTPVTPPPVTPNTPPTTQVTPPPVTPNTPPAGNSNAEFQTIVDKFEKTFKELEGLTKGDPAAQSELEQIKRSAGY